VLQAPMFDGLAFDPFTLFDDGLGSTEVGIGGCYIVQALVIALMVVALDERRDLGLSLRFEGIARGIDQRQISTGGQLEGLSRHLRR